MKLTILQSKLKEILNLVEKIPTKNSTLPILNNILLKTKENFLELSTTDLEIGIRAWSLAKIEKKGELTVPVQILSSYVGSLNPLPLKLEVKKETLFLECDNTKTQIKGSPSEDFPIIPEAKEGKIISLSGRSLCQGLSQIVNICSLSTIRPEISGVYFSIEKDLIKMVATDSFRLGEKKIFFKKPFSLSETYSLILPQKAAFHLISIFDQEDLFKIYLSPNLLMFESSMKEVDHSRVQFVSKLI